MYVETPSGGNLLMEGWARAVTGRPRAISDEADAADWLLIPGSLALMGLAGWFLYGPLGWVVRISKTQYETQSIWAYVGAMVVAITLGRLAYYLREVRPKWWIYPPVEIGIGLGLAALAVKPGLDPVVNILALLGSVRVIVDGITRFRNFRSEAQVLIAKKSHA